MIPRRYPCVLIVCLTLMAAGSHAFAATYYVDATHGLDSRSGASPATAWKTLNKVNQRTFSPGDTILLERGEFWRERLVIASSGTETSPITVGAYGTGDLPLLDGTSPVTGWTQASPTTYRATVSTAPEIVFFANARGNRAASLTEVDAQGDWYWASGTLTVYATATPSGVEATIRQWLIESYNNTYVNFENLAVRRGIDCVRLVDTTHITLSGLQIFDAVGYAGLLLGSVTPGRGTDNTIRNCAIQNIIGSTESLAQNGNGSGVFIWGQNVCGRNRIENNQVSETGGAGILIIDSADNVIASNTVFHAGSAGIVLTGLTSSRNTIEKNHVFENCLAENDIFGINLYMPGNDNTVRYNITHDQYVFTDEEVGIPNFEERSGGIRFDGDLSIGVPDKTGNRIYGNLIYNEFEGIQVFNFSGVTVFNNTVVNVTRSGIHISCFGVPGSGDSNRVINNLVAYAENHAAWNDNATNTTFDYNAYYSESATPFEWNGTHSTFAQWKTNSGQEVHAIFAEPRFRDGLNLNFRLSPDSPCIDAGDAISTGLPDLDGIDRPQGPAVDIGAYEAGAKPTASFSATPLSGDIPLFVQFTDTSTPGSSAITAWSWDLDGDGDVDSTDPNPSFIYTAWGKYSVALTVTNGAGSHTHTETGYINVTSGPDADFDVSPASGFAPLNVTFTDRSTPGSSTITAWSWDFDGDGVEDSAVQNPSHVFGQGTHTVTLTVTTADSQTDTRTKSNCITVEVLPAAAFSFTPSTGYAPLTATFSDLSTSGSQPITHWEWDFGDTSPHSSERNPTHIYAAAGLYTVTLTVTSSAGNDSETQTHCINVLAGTPPAAAFTATPTSGIRPLTVQFSDASSPGTSPITERLWDFGDGNTSPDANPAHVYTSIGAFTVSLTVTSQAGSNTLTKTSYIHVNPAVAPEAAFICDKTAGPLPLLITFTDTSQAGTSPVSAWHWDFGDGAMSNAQHPQHTYTTPGVYPVSLTVITNAGEDTETKSNYIAAYSVVFVDKDNTSGVENGTSWATAFTTLQPAIDTAAGADVPQVWVAEGVYNERRNNANGSLLMQSGVALYGGFESHELTLAQRDPAIHPSIIDGTTARNGSRAYHTVTGADSAVLDGFTIQGGRADSTNQSRDRGAGLYNNSASPTITQCIFNGNEATLGGAAIYNSGNAAPLIQRCFFKNNTALGTVMSPGYGGAIYNAEGTASVIINSIFYTNAAKAALFSNGYGGAIYNRSCSSAITNCTFSQNQAYAAMGVNGKGGALYTTDSTVLLTNCILWNDTPAGLSQSSGTVSVNYTNIQGGYGSGTGNLNSDPMFIDDGNGNLSLQATSPSIDAGTNTGAPLDDYTGVIRPQGLRTDQGAYELAQLPTANFTAAPTAGIAPLEITFTDASLPGSSPITGWEWDFGDGATSSQPAPIHTYTSPGIYSVSLHVTTQVGPHTVLRADYIHVNAPVPPEAAFTCDKTFGIAPLTVAFTDQSAPGTSPIEEWRWTFGDGAESPLQHPAHTYSTPGTYNVNLRVTSDAGADVAGSLTLTVGAPFAFLEHPQSQIVYTGDSPMFRINAAGGLGTRTFEWWLDNGKGSKILLGSGSNTFTLSSVTPQDNGIYWCRVTDDIDTYDSNAAQLTVYDHLVIEDHPINDVKNLGETAVFSVIATGGAPDLHYTWYRAGMLINNSDSPVLTVSNIDRNDEAQYYVIVTDGQGESQTSNAAFLDVILPVPAADGCGMVTLALIFIAGTACIIRRKKVTS